MAKKIIAFCCALVALCAAPPPACGLPVVKLEAVKAVGGYADPHEITVDPGTPVRLVYTISYAENLTYFQNNVTVIGDTASIDATDAGTWWGDQLTTSLDFWPQAGTGMYILLGETAPVGAPYSYSDPDEVSLAFIDLTPLSDTVVIDLLSLADPYAVNMWLWCHPDDPADDGELLIDLANSNPVVTIHVGHEDVIPEPTSLLLLTLGHTASCLRRRR